MKLPICIAILFLAAYASLHLAPEPKLDVDFSPPTLGLPPDFTMEPHFMKPDKPVTCIGPQFEQRCTRLI